MYRKIFLIGILLLAWFIFPGRAAAQGDGPVTWTGVVAGQLENRSPGAATPVDASVMLHGWDENQAEKLMLHGQMNQDGSFRFEEVAFEQGLRYAVMADYAGAAYFSEVIETVPGESFLNVTVPVYETTPDLAAVRIQQMHVLFDWEMDGLSVSEVYILSNEGEYTVKDAVTVADGNPATLKFTLPEAAANVSFGHESGARFIQFSGGFADTSPLPPGQPAGQVSVSYLMPYRDGLVYKQTAPVDIQAISYLFPKDLGLNLEADGLLPQGEWESRDGRTFSVYAQSGLQAGQTMQIKINGKPSAGQPPAGRSVSSQAGPVFSLAKPLAQPRLLLGIGGSLIGLGLVLLGLKLRHRPEQVSRSLEEDFEEDHEEAGYDDLIKEIAALYDAHDAGEVEEEQFILRRQDLLTEIKIAKAKLEKAS